MLTLHLSEGMFLNSDEDPKLIGNIAVKNLCPRCMVGLRLRRQFQPLLLRSLRPRPRPPRTDSLLP